MAVGSCVKGSRTIRYEGGADALTFGHAPDQHGDVAGTVDDGPVETPAAGWASCVISCGETVR